MIDNWGWPQCLHVILMAINLLIMAHLHGKPKTGYYNFADNFWATVFAIWVYYCGGFYS